MTLNDSYLSVGRIGECPVDNLASYYHAPIGVLARPGETRIILGSNLTLDISLSLSLFGRYLRLTDTSPAENIVDHDVATNAL